jgi:hypothetical protein
LIHAAHDIHSSARRLVRAWIVTRAIAGAVDSRISADLDVASRDVADRVRRPRHDRFQTCDVGVLHIGCGRFEHARVVARVPPR